MRAKSIKGNSLEDVQVALRQSMQAGFAPTLAAVPAHVNVNRAATGTIFTSAGFAIFGAKPVNDRDKQLEEDLVNGVIKNP